MDKLISWMKGLLSPRPTIIAGNNPPGFPYLVCSKLQWMLYGKELSIELRERLAPFQAADRELMVTQIRHALDPDFYT